MQSSETLKLLQLCHVCCEPLRYYPLPSTTPPHEVVDNISRRADSLLEIVKFNVEVCSTSLSWVWLFTNWLVLGVTISARRGVAHPPDDDQCPQRFEDPEDLAKVSETERAARRLMFMFRSWQRSSPSVRSSHEGGTCNDTYFLSRDACGISITHTDQPLTNEVIILEGHQPGPVPTQTTNPPDWHR